MLSKGIRIRLDGSRWRPSLAAVLLVLWILFIIYGTTLPFRFSASSELVHARIQQLWEHPIQRGGMRADAASNVLLFIPLGCLLAAWLAGRGASFVGTVILAAATGAILSGSVEFAQLFLPKRTPSVLDVATNTLGSTMGAMVGGLWTRWLWPICTIHIRQSLVARPLKVCALAAALGLVIVGISPFDRIRDRNDVIVSLRKGRPVRFGPRSAIPKPSTEPWDRARDLLRWTLAGELFYLAACESGRRGHRALILSATAAGSLCLAIEVSHTAITGHALDLTSVALALLGSAIAASLARSALGDAGRLIRPAIFIWCSVIVLAAWSPWRFALPQPPFLTRERMVPYWSYFYSRSLADLADVIGQALLFLPLGTLLAARSRKQTWLGAIFIGFGLSFVLEFGQVFLPSRLADVSDVISAAIGTGLGLAFWRWGESTLTDESMRVFIVQGDDRADVADFVHQAVGRV